MRGTHFIVFILFNVALSTAIPEVQLANGIIRGKKGTTIQNTNYYAFEKVPYAKPPLGELRFMPPVPPDNWNEPLDTVDLDVCCYGRGEANPYETEDCLYLNVYTPKLQNDDNNVTFPVMYFIHGGGFESGSGRGVYADRLLDEGIVFVTGNYRLGPFGFLSTADKVLPGNNGLKDQLLTMQWIHNNIHLFGGDPDRVTIFGQSAGSASVAYHLLNQQSAGLFRAALLLSGTFLSPWTFQRNPRAVGFGTASYIDETFKTNNDSYALYEFLKTVDGKKLDIASVTYHNEHTPPEHLEIMHGYYWTPVVEVKNPTAFLTKKMYGLLAAGNVLKVPIMIGMTSEESLRYHQNPGDFKNLMQNFDNYPEWLVLDDMYVTNETQRKEIGTAIHGLYTNGEPFTENLGDSIRFFTDTTFARSIIKHAELFSQFADTYFYQFSYDGEMGHMSTQYGGADHVGHGQDLGYILCGGTNCDVSRRPESDQITVQRYVKLVTNFAKFLNPTPEPEELLQDIIWPKVSTVNGDFLYLNINNSLEIRNHPKERTYQTWVKLYDSINHNDFDTY